jgi:hypothetical protein
MFPRGCKNVKRGGLEGELGHHVALFPSMALCMINNIIILLLNIILNIINIFIS